MDRVLFTLERAIRHWGLYCPARTAVWSQEQQWTFSYLHRTADSVSRMIFECEKTSSRIGVLGSNSGDTLAAWIGVMRAGASFMPLDPNKPVDQLAPLLRGVSCDTVLADSWSSQAQELKVAGFTVLPLSAHPEAQLTERTCETPSVMHDNEICVLFTSGSGGEQLPVPKSHYSLFSELIQWVIELSLHQCCSFALAMPIFYTGGLVTALSTLLVGGTVILVPQKANRSVLAKLQELAPTHLFLLAPQYRGLSQGGLLQADALPSVKTALSMGEHLEQAVRQEVERAISGRFLEAWGNTEGLGTIANPNESASAYSVGRPFITDEIVILDESGRRVRPGTPGLIAGLSDNCYKPALPHAVTSEGHVLSSDIGYVDDKGYLVWVGRQSDVIINSNRIVASSAHLEDLLRQCPHVLDAAVVMVANGKSRSPFAFLISDAPDFDAELAIATVNGELDLSGRISGVQIVDSLPRTPTGKVDKHLLVFKAQRAGLSDSTRVS